MYAVCTIWRNNDGMTMKSAGYTSNYKLTKDTPLASYGVSILEKMIVA